MGRLRSSLAGLALALALALMAVLLLGAGAGSSASPAAADWPHAGGDDQLTGYRPGSAFSGLTTASAGRLHAVWSVRLDGPLVASPLYAARVAFGAQRRDVVYAATGAGSVYGLASPGGRVLWQRRLGTVRACGRRYGVDSTGVLDRARSRLYVIGASGLLHALDLATGREAPGWPLRVSAHPDAEYVWGGLALDRGRGLVYVPVASYCDDPGASGYTADGRLVAVAVARAAVAAQLDVVPGPQNGGGIWGWGGASLDPLSGHLWTATGNALNNTSDFTDHALQVLELDPVTLAVLAANRPRTIGRIASDDDFGSAPLLFRPRGCPALASAEAKDGTLYVWRRASLAAGPLWSMVLGVSGSFIGEPSWSPATQTLYVSAAARNGHRGVAAVRFAPGCARPPGPAWVAGHGAGPEPPPLVVGGVVFEAGGGGGRLSALDARTGALLWSAALGGAAYAGPVPAGRQVLVGTTGGLLYAFGLGA